MRAHSKERIADDGGLHRHADRGGELVHDAPVLHVPAEQAEPLGGGLGPGDRAPVGEAVAMIDDEHIALAIERRQANIFERLVVEIGDAAIDLERVEGALDRARRQRLNLDAGLWMRSRKARRQQ